MDEMIVFLRSLANVTTSAALAGSLYPQDLYSGTDWMLQSSGKRFQHKLKNVFMNICFVAAVTADMKGTDEGLNNFTLSFSEAISALCDVSTMGAWSSFRSGERVSELGVGLMTSMHVMATSLLFIGSESEHRAWSSNVGEIKHKPSLTCRNLF